MKTILRSMGWALLILTFTASPLWAQLITFSANTPARAADVNANFTYLDNANATQDSAITALTPVALGPEYGTFQYGPSATTPNVIVLQGADPQGRVYYRVRISYETGTTCSAGDPTTCARVRQIIDAETTDGVTLAKVEYTTEGTDAAIGAGGAESWESDRYEMTGLPASPAPSLITNTRTRRFQCFGPNNAGLVRHCELRVTDTDAAQDPDLYLDRSTLFSVINASFTVKGFTFPNGGARVSVFGNARELDYALHAMNIGSVLETHTDVGPGLERVTYFVIYYKLGSSAAIGNVASTPFGPGGALLNTFFTP